MHYTGEEMLLNTRSRSSLGVGIPGIRSGEGSLNGESSTQHHVHVPTLPRTGGGSSLGSNRKLEMKALAMRAKNSVTTKSAV